MKAGQLHHAIKPMLVQHAFCHLQKVIEVQKIIKECRMNQQRRVNFISWRVDQQVKLAVELFQQVVRMTRLTDHQANLVFDIHRLGKRAQVEPDHGFFKPEAGRVQDFLVGHDLSCR